MDEAIAWHLGLEQAGVEEWHRFVCWLEADPAHAEAYDRLTMESAALAPEQLAPIAPALAPPSLAQSAPARMMAADGGQPGVAQIAGAHSVISQLPVRDRFGARRRRSWTRWGGVGGGVVAAAAAAWLAFVPAAVAPESFTIETQPGMHHTVKLADGTTVDMNGGTRLMLDRDRPRLATLERGEAIFHVVHNAEQPFEVRSGGVTLRDVGTVFNVARSGAALRVAVAEGSVLYQPEREAVPLSKGMALAMRDGDDRVTLSHVQAETVGGWSDGHLDFRDVALAIVAEDVSRSTGARLKVAPALRDRLFTGTLRLDRPSDEVMRSLAALADSELHRDGPSWVIGPKSGGAH